LTPEYDTPTAMVGASWSHHRRL